MLAYMRRFALNIAQKRLAAGLCPGPLGAYSAPDSLAGLRGKAGDGKGEGGGERKGRGGEREGKGGRGPPRFIFSGYVHVFN